MKLSQKDRQDQTKIGRYAKTALRSKFIGAEIIFLAHKHYPYAMRQWASEQIQLRAVEMQRRAVC